MHPKIEPAAVALDFARRRFTHGMKCVPEDRLEWSPGGSASSPLKIASKMAGFLSFIADAFAKREFGRPNRNAQPEGPKTVAEANAAVDAAFERLMAALDSFSEEDLAVTLTAPWKQELPLTSWVYFVNQVVGYWQGQLNATQLAYGDTEANVPIYPFDE